MYKHCIKRLLDISLSLVGIALLAIPFLLIAIVIKIDSPGPVFFKQQRVGKNKELFSILKFRSMPVSAPRDIPTHQLKASDYTLTRFQKFLRKSSIDELPQLFCILSGKMSVIGPRPALWNQDDLVAERDKYGANDVRPGLTGWAQINGRDELEIPVKARLDGEYVRRLSFLFDCKCFFGTIRSVIRSEGFVEAAASAESNPTSDALNEEQSE